MKINTFLNILLIIVGAYFLASTDPLKLRKVLERFSKQKHLFHTHSESLAHVGATVQKSFTEDKYYRVTKVVELIPTGLINGGFARCWSVFGVYDPNLTAIDMFKHHQTFPSSEEKTT